MDTLRAGTHSASLDYGDPGNLAGAIYGLSAGGRAPGGWLCRHLPAQAEFDNGPSGTPDKPGQWPLVWGREEISWFAHQPAAYRNEWLIYAQGRVRQAGPRHVFSNAGGAWRHAAALPRRCLLGHRGGPKRNHPGHLGWRNGCRSRPPAADRPARAAPGRNRPVRTSSRLGASLPLLPAILPENTRQTSCPRPAVAARGAQPTASAAAGAGGLPAILGPRPQPGATLG
ncbi:MAG: hypothetical protein WKG07_22545 [Hymenobacter sp.]